MITYFRLLVLFLISLSTSSVFGQEVIVKLKGKVQSLNNDISNVLIFNFGTKKYTITDDEGFFSLDVKLKDSLQFSAIQYVSKDIIVTNTILSQKMIFVNLEEKVNKLDEVEVLLHNLTGNFELDAKRLSIDPIITSSSLSLPNSNVKVKTRSERLLHEADGGKFSTAGFKFDTINLITGFYVRINVHKILNRVSGRTKALKEGLSRDEVINAKKKLVNMFSKTTLSKELGIPKTNIEGFLNFCLAQKDFSKLLETENPFQIWEYIKVSSTEYKEINN